MLRAPGQRGKDAQFLPPSLPEPPSLPTANLSDPVRTQPCGFRNWINTKLSLYTCTSPGSLCTSPGRRVAQRSDPLCQELPGEPPWTGCACTAHGHIPARFKSLLVDNQHFLQCAGCSTGMLWFSRSLCEEATGAGEEQAEGDAEPATNPVPVSQNVGGAAAPGWARKQGNNGGKSRGSEGDTDHRTLTVIQYSTENWMHFCVNSSELGMLRIL